MKLCLDSILLDLLFSYLDTRACLDMRLDPASVVSAIGISQCLIVVIGISVKS